MRSREAKRKLQQSKKKLFTLTLGTASGSGAMAAANQEYSRGTPPRVPLLHRQGRAGRLRGATSVRWGSRSLASVRCLAAKRSAPMCARRTAACTSTLACCSSRVKHASRRPARCATASWSAALLVLVAQAVARADSCLTVLSRDLDMKGDSQLWACCAAHKAAALREVLKVRTLHFLCSKPGPGPATWPPGASSTRQLGVSGRPAGDAVPVHCAAGWPRVRGV